MTSLPFRRSAGIATTLLLATVAVACSDPAGPTPPPIDEPTLTISSVTDLEPGEMATLRGANLNLLQGLTVDGTAVTTTAVSPTEITFTVPEFRTCETDGRTVAINATETGSGKRATINGTIDVPTIDLAPGASRELTLADFQDCMRFPAGDQSYAFTFIDGRVERSNDFRKLLDVRSWTESAGSPAPLSLAPSLARTANVTARSAAKIPELAKPYTGNPSEFDPTWSTAGVGDTIRFAKFGEAIPYGACNATINTIPDTALRLTEIIAVEGKTVVVVDLSGPNASTHLSDQGKAYWSSIAAAADPLRVPAAKLVYGDQFEPLKGADGRYFVIITPLTVVATPDGVAPGSEADCALFSETMATLINDGTTNWDGLREAKVSALIHEYGHLAADASLGYYGAVNDWMEEALAVLTEGAAFRIETNQPTSADPTVKSNVQFGGLQSLYGRLPNHNPFDRTLPGVYSNGALVVLYAQERFDGNLYQEFHRTFTGDPYAADTVPFLNHLASLVGMTAAELHDQALTAAALQNLTDATGIPQFSTWSRTDAVIQAQAFGTAMPRSRNAAAPIEITTGAFNSLYLFPDAGKGISLTFGSVDLSNVRVRLYRLD